jgi:hypothetical protein
MICRMWFSFCLSSLVITALGCGQAVNPNLAPVTGIVRHNGSPVAGANVVFRSETAVGYGMTDRSGRFSLRSQGEVGDGVLPGTYKVMVTKIATANVVMQDIDEAAENPVPEVGPEGEDSSPQNELPAHYADFVNTPLEFTVRPGEANDFTIDLE